MHIDQTWRIVLNDLKTKARVRDSEYRAWLELSRLIELDPEAGTALVGAPDTFIVENLTRKYKDKIAASLSVVARRPITVNFSVLNGAQSVQNGVAPGATKIVKGKTETTRAKSAEPDPASRLGTGTPLPVLQLELGTVGSDGLNPRYLFSTFVVGPSNRLAHAASLAVADNPGAVYNPLFIYGGVGLGKTHLMHATGHHARARHGGDMRVLYLTSERFTNELIASIRSGKMEEFRDRYRTVDILMIDDIQFIAGKESTQEEFFHTLNELISSGRKVVISADRGPQDLAGLQDRILSRLAGGMVADVDQADYELRLNVLHAKLGQLHDVACPNDVLEFLARKITSNVRELEGALTRVAAYATLTARAITIETTRQVLADQLRAHDRRITIDEIQRKTADYYGLKLADLLSPRRAREVARPRQVAMYLAKKLTPRSLPEIGRRFGGRDHTTVMHGVKRIEELRVADTELNGDVAKLLRAFDA